MAEILNIRIVGSAGHITLTRVDALNALTLEMIRQIRRAIATFNSDPKVDIILLDAEGERAFCAGGDLSAIFRSGMAGNFAAGQEFWAEEYRMNLEIATSAKPVVSFMHGFVMGGGIGLGCHAALRIAAPDTVFAVSQVKVGLAPDAGASFLLSLAPGRMGEYLGATGRRFSAADAVWLGFADKIIEKSEWPRLKTLFSDGAGLDLAPDGMDGLSQLSTIAPAVDAHFGGEGLADIWRTLLTDDTPFGHESRELLGKASPLAASVAIEMMHRLGNGWPMDRALGLEYRFAFRAQESGDILEGIRAAIIDKDQTPRWRNSSPESVAAVEIARMLMPLGPAEWRAE